MAVSDDGVFEGVNVENAAYASTICAETNALTAAATHGIRRVPLMAVGCLDADECIPCGNCRQVMREFGVEWVVFQGQGGRVRLARFDDLLPDSFGPESLPGVAVDACVVTPVRCLSARSQPCGGGHRRR